MHDLGLYGVASCRGQRHRYQTPLNLLICRSPFGNDGPVTDSPILRPFEEIQPTFSRDGKWLAYVSDESGRFEVYLRPYSRSGGRMQVSTEGGTEPRWARNGRELFFRSGNKMMVVEILTEPSLKATAPQLLFEGSYMRNGARPGFPEYDVTADGQRFVMVQLMEPESAPTQINVVLNWFEELKGLVSTP